MYTPIFSFCLGVLGSVGTVVLVISTAFVIWHFRGTRRWSFRWHWRNWRLMQLSAIACLFFLAMSASYGLLGELWAWVYLLAAFKAGTCWLRFVISRRA